MQVKEFEVRIFDKELLEKELLDNPKGKNILKRYFPLSYDKWKLLDTKPNNLFDNYEPLEYVCCGKDLLIEKTGIIVFVQKRNTKYVCDTVDIYWVCKGECDEKKRNYYETQGYSTAWEDIGDIAIPGKYLSWNMAILNRMYDNIDRYEKVAFEKLKQFIISISQIVLRDQTDEQIKRLMELSQIPSWG